VTFSAGQKVTAAQLNMLIPVFVRQVADTSPVNNSTTLVNDTEMVFPVAALTTYEIRGRILFTSATAADIKIGWTFPTGLTMFYSVTGFQGATFSSFDYIQTGNPTCEGAGVSTNDEFMIMGIVVVSSTAGNLQLQFAQNTLNASNTVIKAGSHIILTPLVT
jgi:hypothetical protein